MKTKAFDCVEMKRRGAIRIFEETKGMTVKEQVAYWRKQTAALRRRQQAAKKQRRSPRRSARVAAGVEPV
jgi:sRNA-binding protein